MLEEIREHGRKIPETALGHCQTKMSMQWEGGRK